MRSALFLRVEAPTPDEPHAEDFDGSGHAWFCRVLAWTEMAAHHNEIAGCAACRSAEIPRMPFEAPHQFGVMTTPEGIRYGYALCASCRAKKTADSAAMIAVVEGNFDGVGVA